MTDHTPTPWQIYSSANPHHIKIKGIRPDIGGAHVADVLFPANADFLLKAVNNHDALVEALKHAKARFECLADDFKDDENNVNWAMCSVDADRMQRALDAVSSPGEPNV